METGGLDAFLRRALLLYAPAVWDVPDRIKVGDEMSVIRTCCTPQPRRPLAEIRAAILVREWETEGRLGAML